MNEQKHRPYLSDRHCGRCLIPLETSERREGGWMYVTFRCQSCGFNQVITFSPDELLEWQRRASGAHGFL